MASSQIGNAGVYYVAAYLSSLGFHVAPTFGNVPQVDALVATSDGTKLVELQVKTSSWAGRTRGRGTEKKPHHYEWDVGWNCARLNRANLFFAFVDLKNFDELPDVFLIPSSRIFEYFGSGERGPETGWIRARYHPEIMDIEEYKNNWRVLGSQG